MSDAEAFLESIRFEQMAVYETQQRVVEGFHSSSSPFVLSGYAAGPGKYKQGGLDGIGECLQLCHMDAGMRDDFGEGWWFNRWKEFK